MEDTSSLTWRKASKSGANGAQCVELATASGQTYVRDSKRPGDGHLTVTPAAFGELLTAVKAGQLDL